MTLPTLFILSTHRGHKYEVATILAGPRPRTRNIAGLDYFERAQIVADLLSLPQPALAPARALHLAAWLIRLECRRNGPEFLALVAERIAQPF